MTRHLGGKRVLILGAETEIGRAVTTSVAEAGASVAAVAATSDAEAAFAVQRLARRLSSGEQKVIAQAIDATNEAAVRVMVRQVSKELGGLDAVVLGAARDVQLRCGYYAQDHAGREFARQRVHGVFVFADSEDPRTKDLDALASTPLGKDGKIIFMGVLRLATSTRSTAEIAEAAVAAMAVAGPVDSG